MIAKLQVILSFLIIFLSGIQLLAQKNFQVTSELGTSVSFDHNIASRPFSFDYSASVGMIGKINKKARLEVNALFQMASFRVYVFEGYLPSQTIGDPPAKFYDVNRILYMGPEIGFYYDLERLSPFVSLSLNTDIFGFSRFEAFEDGRLIDSGVTQFSAVKESVPMRTQLTVGVLTKEFIWKLKAKIFYRYQFVPKNVYNSQFKSISSIGVNIKI